MKFLCLFKRLLLPVVILMLFCASIASAQRIKSEVVLHTKALSLEEQRYLEGFETEVVRIIDEFHWTESKYRYELPVHIEIFFEEYMLIGSYHKYSVGVLAAMRQGVQLRDNRWDFKLNRELGLYIGGQYDTFTGMLEYIIWICLGFEADRLSVHGGTEYFEKARLLTEQARFENHYYNGWDERRELVEALIVKRSYKNIRKASFYVKAGFHYIDKGDIEKARNYLREGVRLAMKGSSKMLEVNNNDSIFRFIDRERLSIVLKDIEEYGLLDKLAGWDAEYANLYEY